jgi:DNA-binding NarL/FixJ family response regulator
VGDALLDPAIPHHVIDHFPPPPPRPVAPPDPRHRLTDRELDVLRQLARGLSNAEIAAELVVSEATVKTHIALMLAKLQLRDRVQAVVYAYRHGLTGDQSP